jgi:predicted nucleic acid-binding protein
MYVADASVWVSASPAGDRFHVSSRRFFETFGVTEQRLFEPTLMLVEVAGALARQGTNASAVMALLARIHSLPELSLTDLDEEMAGSAARIAWQRRTRGSDAVYIALAETLDVPLVTWDRRQAEAAGARALTRDAVS